MKRCVRLVFALLLAVSVASAEDSATTFAKLKKLVGTWEVKLPDGKITIVKIESIAAGSALMQTQPDEHEGTMVTMIHPDGNRLLLTHYCSAKNQPRMVADSTADGKTIRFNFLDITNLPDPEAGHMRGMIITMEDQDHITQQWQFRENGKELSETFPMVRKK